jgi:type II secretory pathway pseudopilin PulG
MKHGSQEGFSYIEVIIAMVIFMVGILSVMTGLAGAVVQSRGQEQQLAAKQHAASALESIMSVKETDPSRLGWPAVGNVGTNPVGGTPRGIFVVGQQPIRLDAGPDKVIGTADDTGDTVQAMSRQIIITDLCDPDRPSPNCNPPGTSGVRMRSVQVIVRYFVGALQRQEQLTTVMTDYAVVEDS